MDPGAGVNNLRSKANRLPFCFVWCVSTYNVLTAAAGGVGQPLRCLFSFFLQLAVVACVRQACVVRSLPAEEAARRRTWASSVTLFFLEISVVYQTIAVVVTW